MEWPYGRIRAEGNDFNNMRVRLIEYRHAKDAVLIELITRAGNSPPGTQHLVKAEYYKPEAPPRQGKPTLGQVLLREPDNPLEGLSVECVSTNEHGVVTIRALETRGGMIKGTEFTLGRGEVVWGAGTSATGRKNVPPEFRERALELLRSELLRRLMEKGEGTYASRHEIAGSVDEEWLEMHEALRGNDMEQFKEELIDLAVGCIFGAACIEAGLLDW